MSAANKEMYLLLHVAAIITTSGSSPVTVTCPANVVTPSSTPYSFNLTATYNGNSPCTGGSTSDSVSVTSVAPPSVTVTGLNDKSICWEAGTYVTVIFSVTVSNFAAPQVPLSFLLGGQAAPSCSISPGEPLVRGIKADAFPVLYVGLYGA